MSVGNISFVKDFVIVGFPGLQPHYYGLVSALLLFVYVFTLVGNAVFFTLFLKTKSLQKPVYYFIINLVVCDVLFSTTTLPKIISRYWFQDGTISFLGCFVQMFFVHYLGSVCSLALAVMAIDRYAAICYPLQYHSIMTNRNVLICILCSWVLSLVAPLMIVIRAYPLPYCTENTIVHCYCDHVSITTLACTDRALYSVPALIGALVALLGSLAIIIFSYFSIFVAVMRISSTRGRLKTFSTCSPQLIIIALYFLPRCFIYLSGNIGIKFNTDLRLVIIMMYSLLPPMVNPLIYCLRTEEVKKILRKQFKKRKIGLAVDVDRSMEQGHVQLLESIWGVDAVYPDRLGDISRGSGDT
ncbi:olfactory receptor 1E16-like [Pseudorasbora parva]|uniref:olfactory receptor 1E16-like n=1 Tax=Pseudorasbora parva TaxID=51549 RepID=UPI00351E16C5